MQMQDRRSMMFAAAAAMATFASRPAFGQSRNRAPDSPLGFVPDPKFVQQARLLLTAHPAIDLHAHPGVTFARGATGLTAEAHAIVDGAPSEQQTVDDMRAGGMAGGSFAAVADVQILGLRNGIMGWSREYQPGEARASYERQISNLREWANKVGAVVALTPEDIISLHKRKKIAALLTVEGGDFLAGDASYVKTAYGDGVRSITLVHYHPNELGDNQTAEARSGGLTSLGRDVVHEMNRAGMIVDVAHASDATVRGVLKASRDPIMCSHTVLAGHPSVYPRFISDALSKDIAAEGGIIGAWPSGFGATTMNDFIDRIFTLCETVGPDHVALGTDMDANYKPVLGSYRQIPVLVSELLRRGYGTDQTVAFLGGNFLRFFGTVSSKKEA
jgi:membrane dipeptidase